MSSMKRIAIALGVISLLLLADGAYLQVTNNQVGGDTGTLFGNPNFFLSAGDVVLISGGLLLVVAGAVGVVAGRRYLGSRRTAGQQQGSEQPGGRTASRA
jgi:hypothetical protein